MKLEDGKTPLMLACKNGHRRTTELLLKKGADPSLKDEFDEKNGSDGFTSIMFAALFGKHDCVNEVISHLKRKGFETGLTRRVADGPAGLSPHRLAPG